MIEKLTRNSISITKDVFEPFVAMQIFVLNRSEFYFTSEEKLPLNGFRIENMNDTDTYSFIFFDEGARDYAMDALFHLHDLNVDYLKKEYKRTILVTSVNIFTPSSLFCSKNLETIVHSKSTKKILHSKRATPSLKKRKQKEFKDDAFKKSIDSLTESELTSILECDIDAFMWNYINFRAGLPDFSKPNRLKVVRRILFEANIIGRPLSPNMGKIVADYLFSYPIHDNTPFAQFYFRDKNVAERALSELNQKDSPVHLFRVIDRCLFVIFDRNEFKTLMGGDMLEEYAFGKLYFNTKGIKVQRKKPQEVFIY